MSLVFLAEYRKKKPEKANRSMQIYCMRCDGDQFKLSEVGTVHCGNCGSLIRNLFVAFAPTKEPA